MTESAAPAPSAAPEISQSPVNLNKLPDITPRESRAYSLNQAVQDVQNRHSQEQKKAQAKSQPQQQPPQRTPVAQGEVKQQSEPSEKQTLAEFIELEGNKYTKEELARVVKQLPNYQKGMRQAFEEANKLKQSLKSVRGENMAQSMRNLGYSEEQIDLEFQKYAENQLKRFQMSPEQRQLLEREEQLSKREKEIQQHQQKYQEQQRKALEAQEIVKYDQTFQKYIESTGLPYTTLEMREMATLIHKNLEDNVDIDWEEAGEQVKHNRSSSLNIWMKEILSKDPSGKLLIDNLPKEIYDIVRKHSIEKVRQISQTRNPPQRQATVHTPVKKETLTPQQWRERLKLKN